MADSNGHDVDPEAKMMWKKRMVQNQNACAALNEKFLADLDARLQPMEETRTQITAIATAVEQMKDQQANSMLKVKEEIFMELKEFQSVWTQQSNEMRRDYTTKFKQISEQIYDMHRELRDVRSKVREDFLHADTNTHDKLVAIESQCSASADRLHDVKSDTLSLHEKMNDLKNKIIDDRLGYIKHDDEMVRLKEGQEKILRIIRGPDAIIKSEKEYKHASDFIDRLHQRERTPERKVERTEHREHRERLHNQYKDLDKRRHRSSERPHVSKRQRRSRSPATSWNNNNSRGSMNKSLNSHYPSKSSRA